MNTPTPQAESVEQIAERAWYSLYPLDKSNLWADMREGCHLVKFAQALLADPAILPHVPGYVELQAENEDLKKQNVSLLEQQARSLGIPMAVFGQYELASQHSAAEPVAHYFRNRASGEECAMLVDDPDSQQLFLRGDLHVISEVIALYAHPSPQPKATPDGGVVGQITVEHIDMESDEKKITAMVWSEELIPAGTHDIYIAPPTPAVSKPSATQPVNAGLEVVAEVISDHGIGTVQWEEFDLSFPIGTQFVTLASAQAAVQAAVSEQAKDVDETVFRRVWLDRSIKRYGWVDLDIPVIGPSGAFDFDDHKEAIFQSSLREFMDTCAALAAGQGEK